MNTAQGDTLTRRDRKKLLIRTTIIDTAMRLFEQQGFHATSMEQIAEKSDVSKATLYKYFEVKEAIIAAYWQEVIKNSKSKFNRIINEHKTSRARVEAAFRSFMQYIMQSRELYEIYIRYRMANITDPQINERLRSGVAENAEAIISAGQARGEIRDDLPVAALVANLELLSTMQSLAWMRDPDNFDLETSSKMLTEIFLNGAANHAHK